MQEDFRDAHERHWDDADLLFAAQRWANADHLYGMAAECGLKWLIEQFTNSPLAKPDRLHVMEATKPGNAWDRFETYRSGHTLGPKFVLPTNPFLDWDVSQRYANQSHFDSTRVIPHRDGARQVRRLVKRESWENSL